MPRFKVMITRTSYASKQIEVEAENQDAAYLEALNTSGDYDYSEYDADYLIEYVEEVK